MQLKQAAVEQILILPHKDCVVGEQLVITALYFCPSFLPCGVGAVTYIRMIDQFYRKIIQPGLGK
jgi:hypothetical protein